MAETKFLDKTGLTKVLENVSTKLNGKSDTDHSHSTHFTTELAASTNLNNVTTPGWYKCSTNANAANFTNCPTQNAFALEVTGHAGVCQTLYEYMASGQKIYTRNYYNNTWGAWERVYTTTNKPTLSELGAASSGHTHDDKYQKKGNYANSSSDGGAATSADKLNTNAGSLTQPVYFKDGVPVNTQYTLAKSVPSNADFTNTHYASKNVVGSSTATSNTTTALTNGNVYLNSVENGAVTSAHKISGSGTTTVTTDTSGNIVISSTSHPTSLKNPNSLTISLNGTSQGAYDGSGKKDIDITASKVGAYTTSQVDSKINDANKYTDTKISDLINGAPETLDTLGEIATAMKENEDVVAALNDAIGTKANSSDLNTHIGSNVHITSTERSNWNNAYAHAVTNKGAAFGTSAPTLYKITTNSAGHVTAATAVTKSDITALGIPGQDTNTVYTHPTTSGNKHIPAGGSSGQILRWSADGTATWGSDNNTWIAFKGATTDAAGTAGYAPAPSAGAANRYLRSDGTWVVPPNTTYSDVKGATSSAAGTHGLVPAPAAGAQASYLRGDGTWAAFSKSTVGLGNVDNTADANKSVKYATSAGSANSATSASTAGSATKATQDSAGQQINTTYIKGLSVNGRTITYTRGDGTTGTITTQDTNTTYAALTNDEIDACFTEVFG